MSSCCSVSAKSMICPRLRRVLVGFYSMVTRLGGLALRGRVGGLGSCVGRGLFRLDHVRIPPLRVGLTAQAAQRLGTLMLRGARRVCHSRRDARSRRPLGRSMHLIVCIYLAFRML